MATSSAGGSTFAWNATAAGTDSPQALAKKYFEAIYKKDTKGACEVFIAAAAATCEKAVGDLIGQLPEGFDQIVSQLNPTFVVNGSGNTATVALQIQGSDTGGAVLKMEKQGNRWYVIG